MCEFNNGNLPKFNNRKDKQEAKKFSTILSEAKQSLEFNDNYIEGGEEDFDEDWQMNEEDLPADEAGCFSCPYEDELEEQEQKTMVYLIGNYLN